MKYFQCLLTFGSVDGIHIFWYMSSAGLLDWGPWTCKGLGLCCLVVNPGNTMLYFLQDITLMFEWMRFFWRGGGERLQIECSRKTKKGWTTQVFLQLSLTESQCDVIEDLPSQAYLSLRWTLRVLCVLPTIQLLHNSPELGSFCFCDSVSL